MLHQKLELSQYACYIQFLVVLVVWIMLGKDNIKDNIHVSSHKGLYTVLQGNSCRS
jgi:hypothetical protein